LASLKSLERKRAGPVSKRYRSEDPHPRPFRKKCHESGTLAETISISIRVAISLGVYIYDIQGADDKLGQFLSQDI
jgi:hypothetical protein